MKIKDLLGPLEIDKKHRKLRSELKKLKRLSGVGDEELLLIARLGVWDHLDDDDQLNLIRWIYGDINLYDSDQLSYELYHYYQEDMPYGVQKARTGDPEEWIISRLGSELTDIKKQLENEIH